MSRRTRSALATACAVFAASGAVCAAASAAPVWSLGEHPPPPAGSDFKVPLGPPGDLKFWAPNRGLLAVEGNQAIPRGLFTWDGRTWRQLSTVCGGPSDTTRIAWAGPSDFWTVTVPSLPRQGAGVSLCHFKDGEVAASYSTPEQSSDPYRRMDAASCRAVNDCWFGGIGSADPTNEREGAFHLRWDGSGLRSVYYPQGRGISDIQAYQDRFYETTFVGPRPEGRTTAPRLRTPEDRPRLIHRLTGGSIFSEPFSAADVADPDPSDGRPAPVDATDLLALDTDGSQLWAAGGGTLSGAAPPQGSATGPDVYPRGPILARLVGSTFTEVPLSRTFAPDERFVDVAAAPGTDDAWVAVQRYDDRRSSNARGTVARIGADGTVKDVVTLPTSGSGRGSIAKIAFTGADEGWAVTSAGWIFHFSDGSWRDRPQDADPAFGELIDFRPNEAAAQFVPDAPPVDDSRLFAAPPLEIEQTVATSTPQATAGKAQRLPALMTKVRSRLRGRTRLVITFSLSRRAKVGVVGRRGKKVVARYRTRTLKPGRHHIVVRLNPRRYPKRLAFQIEELDLPAGTQQGGDDDGSAGAGDTVTTGGGAGDTVTTGGPAQ